MGEELDTSGVGHRERKGIKTSSILPQNAVRQALLMTKQGKKTGSGWTLPTCCHFGSE